MSVEFASRNLKSTVDWVLPEKQESAFDGRQPMTEAAPFSPAFRTERRGETLVITAESGYQQVGEKDLQQQVQHLLELLDASVSSVVIDVGRTNDCPTDRLLGPTAKLWNRLGKQPGKLALCGLCQHGQRVLRRTKLDSIWKVFATREEALAHVSQAAASRACAETVSLAFPTFQAWSNWGRNFLATLTN